MDDPIKIIFKYKNNNRRQQYNVYIFVGSVSSSIMSILNKIKDMNLYNTLYNLSKKEYSKLEKFYGEFWYKKIFITAHIYETMNLIRKSSSNKKEIVGIYGQDWYKKHVEEHKMIDRTIYYNYNSVIKDTIEKKQKKKVQIIDEDIDIDYKINKNNRQSDLSRLISHNQSGGDYDNLEFPFSDTDDIADSIEEIPTQIDEINTDDEMEMDDISEMYKNVEVDPDSDILKTSTLIKQALNDDKLLKKIDKKLLDFNTEKDDHIHDDRLKNVFNKNYITQQYIFKDDTIKTIKSKICTNIQNNKKFGDKSYIIPSRQYLWSEYFFENKLEKVMIGQKWLRKNELLQIDIEPHINLRVYENLRGNLKLLKDNIKRYGSKIKREDDDFNILYVYDNYFTNNELYLIDIYNELGVGYNPDNEDLKNIIDVYIRIYFPKINTDDVKHILEYLNNEPKVEFNKMINVYDTIKNDLILENEIMKDVENIKIHNPEYKNIFKENYIIQSIIHVNIHMEENTKLDLYRIFDEFILTDTYSFIQYQTMDGKIIYKFGNNIINEYNKKKDNLKLISKWFENAPYGISFKVAVMENGVEKYMQISLTDNNKIEYKARWKEEDKATFDYIKNTYVHVKDLIKKINSEKNKVKIAIPNDNDFKYAFINTLQKFELPNKFTINHNDLSEFSRYFYPYVSLVIEPRKRQSKLNEGNKSSKFGTYLRYKRVSKYENQDRILQRILYFMRNYEYNDHSLADEISKQFNITIERSMEEIELVRKKYTHIKKSRKILKKLENIPKYKSQGIGIDIQGRSRTNYKIRISGARTKKQLLRIITFMNILIYLYTETYLYKKKDRQLLKDKLKTLKNIAKRRNKVEYFVDHDKGVNSVKQMTQLDKKRIGFKPEKNQNQWTRSCQNSGTDKKRRPQQYINNTMDKLLKKGYALNKKTGMYEKRVIVKGKGGKKKEVTIRTVKLQDFDEEGNLTSNELHYACSPDENGEHMYVGFLSRSNNPSGQCMPCCFKKDHITSKNKEKRDYFLQCIGKMKPQKVQEEDTKVVGDRLYILQDTNKIQEGRFSSLHSYLDFIFNYTLNKKRTIKHHYLIKTKNGYFFKYGSKQDENPFLNSISSILDKPISKIKNRIIDILRNDKKEVLFTALNNGDIKTKFKTKESYIKYIEDNSLDFDVINHILSIPGVMMPHGMNIIIFEKISLVLHNTLEKEKIKYDFIPICQNNEEIYNITDKKRENIIILKENKNYYPIVLVNKKDVNQKDIDISKTFKYNEDEDNIINHIKDYYIQNCNQSSIHDISHRHTILTAKAVFKILDKLNNKTFIPKYQVIDNRNKCKYLVASSGLLIPIKPSGSLYDMPILKKIEDKLLDFNKTNTLLKQLYKESNKEIAVEPIGVYYVGKVSSTVECVAILTKTYDVVPIKKTTVKKSVITNNNFIMENKPLYDIIDEYIMKGKSHNKPDDRINKVNYDKYYTESYELFRLEFSYFLGMNQTIKDKLIRIIRNKKLNKNQKRDNIKSMLYKLSDKDLFNIFNKSMTRIMVMQDGGKHDRWVHIRNSLPDISHYKIDNNREICGINKSKNQCSTKTHCHWSHNTCYLSVTKDILISFINKLTEELAGGDWKAKEIFKMRDYFVNDIVNYNTFTERKNQTIVKSTNKNINKILEDLFGKSNIPQIGRRKQYKNDIVDDYKMNIDNPLKDFKEFYIQNIMENNLSIFRAYVNGFYWLTHSYYDNNYRNLGFYGKNQTEYANYFKSLVIDWLIDNKNNLSNIHKYIDSNDKENKVNNFITKIGNDVFTVTSGIVELHVLSILQSVPIIVYNDSNNIIYIFNKGIVYNKQENAKIDKKYTSDNIKKKSINIRFSFIGSYVIPNDIEVIYYK